MSGFSRFRARYLAEPGTAAVVWYVALLPVIALFANRAHFGLALAGVLVVAAAALLKHGRTGLAEVGGGLAQAWRDRPAAIVWAALALAALAALSWFWGYDQESPLKRGVMLPLLILSAVAMPGLVQQLDSRLAARAALFAMGFSAFFLAEEFLGPALYSVARTSAENPDWLQRNPPQLGLLNFQFQLLNGSVITAAILMWPFGYLLWRAGHRTATVAIGLAIAASAVPSFSQSAGSSIPAGLAAFAAARLFPGLAIRAYAALIAVIGLGAPFIYRHIGMLLDGELIDRLTRHSASARILLWQDSSVAALQRPLLGWGVDGGAYFGREETPAAFIPQDWTVGYFAHAHNGFLQAWVDLGAAGATLFTALYVLTALKVLTLPARLRPAAFACLCAYTTVTLFFPGLWQSWWLMIGGYCFAFFAILARDERA